MSNLLKEADLAKRLVSYDARERVSCLEEVEKYLKDTKITEDSYRKLWKALFYSLWVADKTDIQYDLSTRIAKLVHTVSQLPEANLIAWLKSNFEIFHREWNKLDYWRTNKFLSLARFCLNEIYHLLENKKYNQKLIRTWNDILLNNILSEKIEERSQGLTLHVIQIIADSFKELMNISEKSLRLCLEPFIKFIQTAEDKSLKEAVVDCVFKGILNGIEEGKYRGFDVGAYADYLFEQASQQEGVIEHNRKYLYNAYKEFEAKKDIKIAEDPLAEKMESLMEDNHQNEPEPSVNKKRKGVVMDESNGEILNDVLKKEKKNKNQSKREEKAQKTLKKMKNETAVINKDEPLEECSPIVKPKKSKKNKSQPEPEPADEEEEEVIWQDFNDEDLDDEDYNIEDDLAELPEDWDEEELDELGEELIKSYFGDDDGDLGDLSEDQYQEIMSKIQNFPAFLLQTSAQKKKFFEKVNEEYIEKLNKAKKHPVNHARKVKFHMNKIKVKEFFKDKKIISENNGEKNHKLPQKPILKKKAPQISPKNGQKNKKKKVKVQFYI